MFIVFFFKQKTAYEMRISDWSSDVCSSDLNNLQLVDEPFVAQLLHFLGKCERTVASDRGNFGKTVRQIVQRDAPLGSRSIQTLNRQTRLPFHAPVAGNNPHHELLRIRMQCPPIALVPFRLFRRYRSEERRVGKECGSTCRYRGWPDH